MRRVARDLRRYARLRVPLLLVGESGTGKDLAARAVHTLSERSGAFLPLKRGCDSGDPGRRGALRSPARGLHGRGGLPCRRLRAGHRGTLFLDEIGDLPASIQVKLLRIVEDGCVRPLGGATGLVVDVRIVAATWADLRQRVEEGVSGRIYGTVCPQSSSSCRRSGDARATCPRSRGAARRIADEVGKKELTSAALARLVAHPWPGNVRELASVLYRAAATSPGREIRPEHLELQPPRSAHRPMQSLSVEDAATLLRRHAGNVSAAARAAGWRAARSARGSKNRPSARSGRSGRPLKIRGGEGYDVDRCPVCLGRLIGPVHAFCSGEVDDRDGDGRERGAPKGYV